MSDFKKTVTLSPPASGERPRVVSSERPAAHSDRPTTPFPDAASSSSSSGWMIEETTTNGAARSASQTLFVDSETTVHPTSAGPVSVTAQPLYGAPLPPDAPAWARFGRVMSQSIEAAILRGEASIGLRSAMARAWAAWQLGGVTPKQLGSLARSVARSHTAIRSAEGSEAEAVAKDCAMIVFNGLPPETRSFTSRERVLEIVRRIGDIEDPAAAKLEGVSLLLGWGDAARAWATEAIAIAVGEIE